MIQRQDELFMKWETRYLPLASTSVGSRYVTRTRQVSDRFKNGRGQVQSQGAGRRILCRCKQPMGPRLEQFPFQLQRSAAAADQRYSTGQHPMVRHSGGREVSSGLRTEGIREQSTGNASFCLFLGNYSLLQSTERLGLANTFIIIAISYM